MTTASTFIPRKEFLRIQVLAPDSFALLTLSSSNCIRLYSFPASVVDALRRLFEQLSILLSSREDLTQSICEISLDGKPWSNAKSVFTEKLLLDILAVIYQCGYNYLSNIDYGRENNDHLAMAFSKPAFPNSTTTPANFTSLNGKEKVERLPFALSFLSATLVRVIAPPRHLTPAILQAVRASWPRGVISENKVGDNSFELRLKGYKWFQQDTFALRHILALLTSLNSYSFSLLTSISLANHSRVKDLWIFTGPAPEYSLPVETHEQSLMNGTIPDMRRLPLQANYLIDAQQQHKRLTEPTTHLPSPRSTSDSPERPQYSATRSPRTHLLRKPPPRAQVPVSVFRDSDIPDEHHQALRIHMPSTISAGIENMTGVGTVGLKQDILSKSPPPPLSTPPLKVSVPPVNGRPNLRLGSDRITMPPFLTSTSSNKTSQSNPANEKPIPSNPLGINAFRDSAFSSNTSTPITCTGSHKEEVKLEPHSSSGPRFPGGWHSTPVDDRKETSTSMLEEKGTALTPIHENGCHIEAPAMMTPDMSRRKSEAALVGIIASTLHVPSIPQRDKSSKKEPQKHLGNGGQGWVLVNVEGPNAARPAFGSESAASGPSDGTTSRTHEPNLPLYTAPIIIDTMNSKRKKQSTMQSKEGSDSNPSLKRFFSLNRKNL